MTDHERLLSAADVAAFFAERGQPVPARTVRWWLQHGILPGRKVGSRYLTSLPELRAHLGIAEPAQVAPAANVIPMVHTRRQKAS